jgi:hypothetical protein
MSQFQKLKTTQYGNLGEGYLTEFAHSVGCRAYQPTMDGSNPVDSLNACKSKKTKKWEIVSIEVKTKAKMKYYNLTGIDTKDWLEYQEFPNPVYLLFIDYLKGEIYGQWTSKLIGKEKEINYQSREALTFFSLDDMKKFRDLTKDEIEELEKYCQSNYK